MEIRRADQTTKIIAISAKPAGYRAAGEGRGRIPHSRFCKPATSGRVFRFDRPPDQNARSGKFASGATYIPCSKFPVSRELQRETGSQLTASSTKLAIGSDRFDTPACSACGGATGAYALSFLRRSPAIT